jgi:site-specific DNA recombinase
VSGLRRGCTRAGAAGLTEAGRLGLRRPLGQQVHQHYLRGSIFCETCHGRLLYGRHKGRSRHYEYFCCKNRTSRGNTIECESSHLPVEDTADSVITDVYSTLNLSPEVRQRIRADLQQELSEQTGLIRKEAERHEQALKAIEDKQAKLVQLYYRDLVTEDVFATEQEKLKKERRAAKRLQITAAAQLEDIQDALEIALSRLNDIALVYRDGSPLERRILNQAIFTRIDIGPRGQAVGTTLTPVYDAISAWQPDLGKPRTGQPQAQDEDGASLDEVQPCPGVSHREAPANRRVL